MLYTIWVLFDEDSTMLKARYKCRLFSQTSVVLNYLSGVISCLSCAMAILSGVMTCLSGTMAILSGVMACLSGTMTILSGVITYLECRRLCVLSLIGSNHEIHIKLVFAEFVSTFNYIIVYT